MRPRAGSTLLATAGAALVFGAAPLDYARPAPADRYVNVTPSHLFVVWALPHDLGPVAPLLADPARLDSFLGRTAIYLCTVEAAERKVEAHPCKVQILRLNGNDEYSKSAVGAWRTAAVLILPPERTTPDSLGASLVLRHDALVAWFTRFDVRHDELKP